ncbi:MAG: NAD(P)-dependent oxidoreductase [Gammaproteobacteria bacterium]|jgi:3-hydroxyisobutyrate dehydrogenase-like beta-hydroxyacid dehydrogenase|nr:NAD(P)-dependent oxidoreductase [Gammaproteobacteria bacterium]
MSTEKVAFIGLGVMGYPMAGHLSGASLDVAVYNRTDSRAQAWLQSFSGKKAATPAETAADADIVCLCVGNDDDVRSVAYGDTGILAGLKRGAILIDHTTASPELAKELELAANEAGSEFLDAPVSGGQAGAENGALTIMVGGKQAAFDIAKDVMGVYAKSVRLMGPAGSGQLTKAVNQICIAGVLQGLSEGLHFAEKVGLDINAVVDVISKGAAQSWQMENRAATMAEAEFDFGFAVDWMRKDLAIALATANDAGVSLPLTALVDQFYQDVQRQGGGRWDSSSLIQRLRLPDAR